MNAIFILSQENDRHKCQCCEYCNMDLASLACLAFNENLSLSFNIFLQCKGHYCGGFAGADCPDGCICIYTEQTSTDQLE
ncbi:hypothetical protein Anas_12231, partial [Armadillidium nasatum]